MNSDKRDKTIAGIQIIAAVGIAVMVLGVQLNSLHTLVATVFSWVIVVAGVAVFIWALTKFAKL